MDKTRCPQCNRYGSSKLNGFCKSCFKKLTVDEIKFYDELRRIAAEAPSLVRGALLEVGVKLAIDVKPEDRRKIMQIIERRKPNNRNTYIVQGESPLCDYAYKFRKDPEKYAIEKEVADIER